MGLVPISLSHFFLVYLRVIVVALAIRNPNLLIHTSISRGRYLRFRFGNNLLGVFACSDVPF